LCYDCKENPKNDAWYGVSTTTPTTTTIKFQCPTGNKMIELAKDITLDFPVSL